MNAQYPCASCGHTHRTMARVWTPAAGPRWYCHESDHSCYSDRVRSKEFRALEKAAEQ